MKCIIIEDEILARKSLEKLCAKEAELNLIGSFEDAKEALQFMSKEAVDLIFLDIELPSMSGLQFLEAVPYMPGVIVTSGNKNYAFEAFEYEVADFLIKPIKSSRFKKGIEKASSQQSRLSAVSKASAEREVYIKADRRMVRVPFEDIFFLESVGDYVKVVSTDESYMIHGTLSSVDERLAHPRFIKVHRKYIVNMDKISDVEDNSVMLADKVIPMSRAQRPIFLRSVNILKG